MRRLQILKLLVERKFLGESLVMEILKPDPTALLCLLLVMVGFPKLHLSTHFSASWCASLWKTLLGTKSKEPEDHQNQGGLLGDTESSSPIQVRLPQLHVPKSSQEQGWVWSSLFKSYHFNVGVFSPLWLSQVVAAQGSKPQRTLSSFVWFFLRS